VRVKNPEKRGPWIPFFLNPSGDRMSVTLDFLLIFDVCGVLLVSSHSMYDDEDWKDDLRDKKRLRDDEIKKNKKTWKRITFVTLFVIAIIGIFKG